ncbi:hypothetical protein AJ79_08672 [Helicocarpus griseus UAMH5409]|uniref:Protein ROT1 n=1 Tax=Helicocarpus griseus UAMH5409 TaxID=1447875 RepID=A0A2B7WRR0_9EURO|nr:hypothetical protein AJ79_08672 [Helicocarpus griseus UAMH5409]
MLAAFSLLLFLFFAQLTSLVTALSAPRLTGTWTTKSKKVLTGPGFYDPIKDRLKEPSHTGISYSFTDDGFYEEAHFRAVANPTRPDCTKGIMQFQHGTFKLEANGSLILTPFAADGRQLVSNPCAGKNAAYYRYVQPEVFERYEVLTDPFHNVQRLNLYKFDGSPMQPMYLAFKPPQMLPTRTLNPTDQLGNAAAPGRSKRRAKRSDGTDAEEEDLETLNRNAFVKRRADQYESTAMNRLWWLGVIMTSVGGVALIYK